MDNNNESEPAKQYNFMKEVYNSLKDANNKLDHIIQNLREIYYTPIRCPFYDPHLHYRNNENNNISDNL